MKGEIQTLDISPRAKGIRGMWKHVPVGPCAFIAPFIFPPIWWHKVVRYCRAVHLSSNRPSTPLGALIIGEILAETNLPKGAFSIFHVPVEMDPLTTDDRFKLRLLLAHLRWGGR